MKHKNTAPWIVVLVIAGVGEIVALAFAVIFGSAALRQTDLGEQSRLWAAAGWWFLGMLVFTAISAWSFFRLLSMFGRQVPDAPTQ